MAGPYGPAVLLLDTEKGRPQTALETKGMNGHAQTA